MKILLPILMALAVLAASCCRKETITCYDGQYQPTFIGYTHAELKGTIVTWYEKGSITQIGTATYNNFQEKHINKQDTLLLGSAANSLRFTHGYDVEVHVPSSQKTYRITNLQNEGRTTQTNTRCGNTKEYYSCENRIVSYVLNSQQQYITDDAHIYLIK